MERVTFRPAGPDDLDFLYRVYAGTRAEELAPLPWSDEQKRDFLRMQFEAQHRHYREHFARAEFLLVLLDEHPVGRLYLNRTADEIRIVDIALLPEHRGRGVGTGILAGVLAEARQTGRPVRIHVEAGNPALRLYERLGFARVGEGGVYYLLEWRAGETPGGDASGQANTAS